MGDRFLFCGRLHPPEISVLLQQECVRQQCLPVIHMILETLSDAFGPLRKSRMLLQLFSLVLSLTLPLPFG